MSSPARHCAACDSFELGRACPRALGSAHGRRGPRCVRPTSALRNNPTRAPAASPFPSVAILDPRKAPFGDLRGNRTRTEPRGSCSFTRNVHFSRSRFARPETCGAGTGQLGPPDANEAGENRGSQRDPHFDDRTSVTRGRCLPSCETVTIVSDTPVASSSLVGVGPLWAGSTP